MLKQLVKKNRSFFITFHVFKKQNKTKKPNPSLLFISEKTFWGEAELKKKEVGANIYFGKYINMMNPILKYKYKKVEKGVCKSWELIQWCYFLLIILWVTSLLCLWYTFSEFSGILHITCKTKLITVIFSCKIKTNIQLSTDVFKNNGWSKRKSLRRLKG